MSLQSQCTVDRHISKIAHCGGVEHEEKQVSGCSYDTVAGVDLGCVPSACMWTPPLGCNLNNSLSIIGSTASLCNFSAAGKQTFN